MKFGRYGPGPMGPGMYGPGSMGPGRYGPALPIRLAGSLNPPSSLAVVSSYPCTIQWNDNSNNEAGFNIYVGGSCVNCEATNNWNFMAALAQMWKPMHGSRRMASPSVL